MTDDFERELRDRLRDADSWKPATPGLPAPVVHAPRALLAGVAALALLIVIAGTTFAVTRTGNSGRTSLAQAPTASSSASERPSLPVVTAGSTPTPPPVSGLPETGAPASSPASASDDSSAGSGTTTPKPHTPTKECTSADLALTVTTDGTSYTQADPIIIDVRAVALSPCEAAQPEVSITGSNGAANSWHTCHGKAPDLTKTTANVCTKYLLVEQLHQGQTLASRYSWNMQTRPSTGGEPASYLAAGAYTVRYSSGDIKAVRTIQVHAAPSCTAAQLGVTISTDHPTYSHGQVAKITVVRKNMSSSVCEVATGIISTPATDVTGSTVWSGCYATGLPRDTFGCESAGMPPQPAVLTAGMAFTNENAWALDHDGSATTDPGPVPDGNYTLSFSATAGQAAATTTISVTG